MKIEFYKGHKIYFRKGSYNGFIMVYGNIKNKKLEIVGDTKKEVFTLIKKHIDEVNKNESCV
jgi:hypothetical protein